MKRLKIGLFVDTYYPMVDGVVIVVHNYALRLSKVADVTVFAPKPRNKSFNDDQFPYKIVRCNRLVIPFTDYDLGMPAFDFKFKKILKHSDLDIVHIHSPFEVGRIGVKYAKKHHLPIVASLHSQFKKDFYDRTNSKLITHIILKQLISVLNKANYFWAVNKMVAEIFVSYGLKELPGVSYNATDMVFNEDISAVKALRKKIIKHEDDRILLFVGRIDFIKNLDFLMQSLNVLFERGFPFQMVFIGSGPHVKALQKIVEKTGMTDCVRFEGRITDRKELSRYYQASDLFVFPSTYDTNSLVQIEAASQKTPAILIENSATAYMIKNNINGYTSPEDIHAFANRIEEIFKDEVLYNKVSENAYQTVYHSWDEVVEIAYQNYLKITEKWKS